MNALPVMLRLAGRPVILIGDGKAADAKRRLLERVGAQVCGEDGTAALAIVAFENDDEARAAVARLRARGILVNATDRAHLCDFTLPAIIDRDPVIIAISTGGASAGLAKALLQRLEDLLPMTLGPLANGLAAARDAIRLHWPDAAERRHAIDAALCAGGALDALAGCGDIDAWLATPDNPGTSDELRTFIITHDDPDQLTVEQARLLGQADSVYHAPMIAPAILARARADAARVVWISETSPEPAGQCVHLKREHRP